MSRDHLGQSWSVQIHHSGEHHVMIIYYVSGFEKRGNLTQNAYQGCMQKMYHLWGHHIPAAHSNFAWCVCVCGGGGGLGTRFIHPYAGNRGVRRCRERGEGG